MTDLAVLNFLNLVKFDANSELNFLNARFSRQNSFIRIGNASTSVTLVSKFCLEIRKLRSNCKYRGYLVEIKMY